MRDAKSRVLSVREYSSIKVPFWYFYAIAVSVTLGGGIRIPVTPVNCAIGRPRRKAQYCRVLLFLLGFSGSLPVPNKQFVVIANPIPKPSHLVGIPWRDCPAEMKDDVPKIVNLLELHG